MKLLTVDDCLPRRASALDERRHDVAACGTLLTRAVPPVAGRGYNPRAPHAGGVLRPRMEIMMRQLSDHGS